MTAEKLSNTNDRRETGKYEWPPRNCQILSAAEKPSNTNERRETVN